MVARQRNLESAAVVDLIHILIAASLILLIRWLYKLLRHREGLGLGDAKLMALLAAWLGLAGALLSFALAAILGAAIALILLAKPSAHTNPKAGPPANSRLALFSVLVECQQPLGPAHHRRLLALGRLLALAYCAALRRHLRVLQNLCASLACLLQVVLNHFNNSPAPQQNSQMRALSASPVDVRFLRRQHQRDWNRDWPPSSSSGPGNTCPR